MSRCTKVVPAFGAGLVLLFAVGQWANAQTPAQMEYERQQREYWRQQEQQRQEQQRLGISLPKFRATGKNKCNSPRTAYLRRLF